MKKLHIIKILDVTVLDKSFFECGLVEFRAQTQSTEMRNTHK